MTTSVVIPVKDDAERLARCLTALRDQTRPPDEILVVDNGSSDGSAALARAAGAVVVSCSEPGIPAAAASGYDRATGDIILRLDADSIPSTAWVQSVVTAFADRPGVAALSGGARFIDGPRWLRGPLAGAYLSAYAVATAPALGHLPLFGSNLAMRRAAWLEVRGAVHRHDEGVHDDLDLAFHIGEFFTIGHLAGARMGISMRPFRSVPGMRQRVGRGFRTVAVHWPRDFPPVRWVRRALRGARGPDFAPPITECQDGGGIGAGGPTVLP